MADQHQHHDRWIARTLKTGVILSAILLIAGIVLSFFDAPGSSEPAPLTDLLRNGVSLQPGGFLLALGILVLILTPVVRVAATMVTFALEKDWRFFSVSTGVITVLLLEILFAVI